MPVWMEIRCENNGNESAAGDGITRCYSYDNAGPMGMTGDTKASVSAMLDELAKDAKSTGWVKRKGDWYCPHCAKLPISEGED